MRFKESGIAIFAIAHLLQKSSRELFNTQHPPFNYATFLHRVWKQADNVENTVQLANDHCYFMQKRVLNYSSGANKKGKTWL